MDERYVLCLCIFRITALHHPTHSVNERQRRHPHSLHRVALSVARATVITDNPVTLQRRLLLLCRAERTTRLTVATRQQDNHRVWFDNGFIATDNKTTTVYETRLKRRYPVLEEEVRQRTLLSADIVSAATLNVLPGGWQFPPLCLHPSVWPLLQSPATLVLGGSFNTSVILND